MIVFFVIFCCKLITDDVVEVGVGVGVKVRIGTTVGT